jgi:DNA-binding CsgD family transcriptional regulator/tetratricopeptide (TPR) repeat protein
MAASRALPALVGRAGPLAVLDAALERAIDGQPSIVVLSGEAGIGKSRLLAELTAHADGREVHAAVAACVEVGGQLPFLPLAGLLRRALGRIDAERREAVVGIAAEELARLVPELAPGVAAGALPSDAAGRARLFERLLGVVERLAEAPAMLAVEDCHWADDATAAFLAFLARSMTDGHLVLVLTRRAPSRPVGDAREGWLDDLSRLPNATSVELGPLDRSSILAQLTSLGPTQAPDLLERVWRRSDGNPMFAEELLAAAGRGERLPRALADSLDRDLATLSPAARRALAVASVVGRPFDERLVALVLESPPDEVRDALRAALEAHVLTLVDDGLRLAFRHGLLAEAVERSLLPDERRSLHAAVASALEGHAELADPTPGGPAAERAYHWQLADRPAESVAASLDAARAALGVGAYEAADEQFERALRLIDEGVAPPIAVDRVELGLDAADAADLAGHTDRALERARQAAAYATDAGDDVGAGRLHSRIGYFLWVLGRASDALDEHRQAVALVPVDPPSDARARVLGAYAGALMGAGSYAASVAVAEAAVAAAETAAAPSSEARARSVLGSDLVALGDIDRGLAELAAAARLADAADVPAVAVVAHHNRAISMLAADRFEDALAEAHRGHDVARAGGLERRYGPHILGSAADALLRLGRLEEAIETAERGRTISPDGRGTVYLDAVAARTAALLGRTNEAAAWLDRADELAAGELDPDLAAYLAAARAVVALASDRPAEAVAAVDAALADPAALDDPAWSAPLVALGSRALAELPRPHRRALRTAGHDAETRDDAADGHAGDRAGTGDRTDAAIERLSAHPLTGSARASLRAADAWRGRGDADAAWREAVAGWDSVGAVLDAADARYRAAEAMLRARRERPRAEAMLREALSAASASGARPLADAIRRLARQARVDVDTAGDVTAPTEERQTPVATRPRYAGPPLSARELEVLALVADGRSNGEIADALFITRKTASVHVSHILDKLGVGSRVEAAILASRVGILGEPGSGGPGEPTEAAPTTRTRPGSS